MVSVTLEVILAMAPDITKASRVMVCSILTAPIRSTALLPSSFAMSVRMPTAD